MRIVALEEHFNIPPLVARIKSEVIAKRGFPPRDTTPFGQARENGLADLGPARLADMDASGLSVQVLSLSGPGADLLAPSEGVAWAREVNDALAEVVAANPTRYAGFAHLPMTAPEAAADELERCVKELGFCGALINGTTEDKFLDDAAYAPILARAAQLDVAVYLHPSIPPEAVRRTYYGGLPGRFSGLLATAAWGWHAETAVHVLRLILAGTLDKYPTLKLIIGHMGEGLPTMLARCEQVLGAEAKRHLQRPVTQTMLDQVWVTTSGFFTIPPLLAALQTFGADRLLFSVDYPFSANADACAFLNTLPLAPADVVKIAHGNADALLKLPV